MQKRRAKALLIVSILCGWVFPASWGYAQTCSQRIAHLSYGIGIDMNGNVWVSKHSGGILRRYLPDGTLEDGTFNMPGTESRGVAVTPLDNHIWVAHTGQDLETA